MTKNIINNKTRNITFNMDIIFRFTIIKIDALVKAFCRYKKVFLTLIIRKSILEKFAFVKFKVLAFAKSDILNLNKFDFLNLAKYSNLLMFNRFSFELPILAILLRLLPPLTFLL